MKLNKIKEMNRQTNDTKKKQEKQRKEDIQLKKYIYKVNKENCHKKLKESYGS